MPAATIACFSSIRSTKISFMPKNSRKGDINRRLIERKVRKIATDTKSDEERKTYSQNGRAYNEGNRRTCSTYMYVYGCMLLLLFIERVIPKKCVYFVGLERTFYQREIINLDSINKLHETRKTDRPRGRE